MRARALTLWGVISLGGRQIGFDQQEIHPAVLKLGLKYAEGAVAGGVARCAALLQVLQTAFRDMPAAEGDARRLMNERLKPMINFIVTCRPLSIGMGNAVRWVGLGFAGRRRV